MPGKITDEYTNNTNPEIVSESVHLRHRYPHRGYRKVYAVSRNYVSETVSEQTDHVIHCRRGNLIPP